MLYEDDSESPVVVRLPLLIDDASEAVGLDVREGDDVRAALRGMPVAAGQRPLSGENIEQVISAMYLRARVRVGRDSFRLERSSRFDRTVTRL